MADNIYYREIASAGEIAVTRDTNTNGTGHVFRDTPATYLAGASGSARDIGQVEPLPVVLSHSSDFSDPSQNNDYAPYPFAGYCVKSDNLESIDVPNSSTRYTYHWKPVLLDTDLYHWSIHRINLLMIWESTTASVDDFNPANYGPVSGGLSGGYNIALYKFGFTNFSANVSDSTGIKIKTVGDLLNLADGAKYNRAARGSTLIAMYSFALSMDKILSACSLGPKTATTAYGGGMVLDFNPPDFGTSIVRHRATVQGHVRKIPGK